MSSNIIYTEKFYTNPNDYRYDNTPTNRAFSLLNDNSELVIAAAPSQYWATVDISKIKTLGMCFFII